MLTFKKTMTILLLIPLLVILSPSPVLAHRMLIEPVEEGIIRVVYEDGRFSRRTEVFVYDHQGRELYSGKLDNQGYFHYPPDGAVRIVADDGLGHRVEWRVGETFSPGAPRGITVAIVVTLFCLIAAFFRFRVNKSRQQQSS